MFSWGGNPGVGSLHRLRDAVEHGWPHPLEIEEHAHAGMAAAYAAGAANLPFGVLRGYLGTDLPKYNREFKFIDCPFTGEQLAAVPAIRPDVTVIHAQKADHRGNVLMWGVVGVQKEAVLAAKRVHRDGGRDRGLAGCSAERGGAAVLGGHARCARSRAARFRPTRKAIIRATTRSTRPGTRLHGSATASRIGSSGYVLGIKDFDGIPTAAWRQAARMPEMHYTADEMMTIAAARMLRNGAVCFVGIGLPSAAANLARLTHAPDVVLIYESGPIGDQAHGAAAVDRRWRACGNRRHRGLPFRRCSRTGCKAAASTSDFWARRRSTVSPTSTPR